jgi:hypothetical protein
LLSSFWYISLALSNDPRSQASDAAR